MSRKVSWVNQMCDLEEQGRIAEAQALLEANATPEEIARFRQALQDGLSGTDLEETQSIIDRVRASTSLPDGDPKKGPWAAVGELKPYQAAQMELVKHLPDPLKKRGRPEGSTIASPENLAEMERRTAAGETKAAAARAIIGDVPWAKSKVKNLVRAWSNRCK